MDSGKKEFNTISVEASEAAAGRAKSYQQILQAVRCKKGNDVYCSSRSACTRALKLQDHRNCPPDRRDGWNARRLSWKREYEQARILDYEGYADDFDWTYYVVESDTPNAFCLPGGYVAVYTQYDGRHGELSTGSYDRGDLDDEKDINMLAAVIGHEIGHALAHHGAKRMSPAESLPVWVRWLLALEWAAARRASADHASLWNGSPGPDPCFLTRS